jgi:hypothetical protein
VPRYLDITHTLVRCSVEWSRHNDDIKRCSSILRMEEVALCLFVDCSRVSRNSQECRLLQVNSHLSRCNHLLTFLAPHTSSPRQAESSSAPNRPMAARASSEESHSTSNLCGPRCETSRSRTDPSSETTRHHIPSRCLQKSQTSSSSSRSAGARMLAVRPTNIPNSTRSQKEKEQDRLRAIVHNK